LTEDGSKRSNRDLGLLLVAKRQRSLGLSGGKKAGGLTVANSEASLISSPPAASHRSPSPIRSKPLGSPDTCMGAGSEQILPEYVWWIEVLGKWYKWHYQAPRQVHM
jgi:hypothetical protein